MEIQSIIKGSYSSPQLERLGPELSLPAIASASSELLRLLSLPRWSEVVTTISGLMNQPPCSAISLDSSVVTAGKPAERVIPESLIQALIPWRKGPFNLCGTAIDAEWRSDLKFERIVNSLGDLRGKKVADVGCNNGYFMFRLAALQPELVVGFDPVERCYLQFMLAQSLIQHPALCFEPLGIEDLPLFPAFFDLVLCLGVIYHRTDPLDALKRLRESIAPGGKLLLESQIIPGDESVALYPPERYGKAKNIHMIPTVPCLKAWLTRTGYTDMEVVSVATTTTEEQRTTRLAPWESLKDFLDPTDQTRTVEGYPAPARAVLLATRS